MKKLFILILVLCINFSLTDAQWFVQNSGQSLNINSVDFVNANTGYAVGDNSRFYKTTNGGLNWGSAQMPGLIVKLEAIVIHPTDQNSAQSSGGRFTFSTTNGGANWKGYEFPSGYRLGRPEYGDITGLIIFIPAYEFNGTGDTIVKCKVFKSTDSGNNWSGISVFGSEPQPIDPPANPLLVVENSSTWYLGTVNGIYITNNGGNSFTQVDTRMVWTINAAGPGLVYAGVSSGDNLLVIKSTNQGTSWTEIASISNGGGTRGFSGMRLLPTVNKIYITVSATEKGMDFLQQDSSVFVSADNGLNWFYQPLPVTGVNIASIDFIDGNTGWIVGSGGTILKTTNGGGDPIGINIVSSNIPQQFSLSQNYPNPFNPVTHFGFQITASGFTSLKIYDQLGRETAVLVNEDLGAGSYEADWNAADLPSGVYFYQLSSNEFTETKKMILIK
jgi:photosystem II stability/assembly factor-like uncharacterized protein